MTLKNTNTKYSVIELIGADKDGINFKGIGIYTKKHADKIYGDAQVLSIKDFPDTCTTSIIIEDKPEYKGFVIRGRVRV